MGQVVTADRDVHFHARRHVIAQHVDDAADGLRVLAGLLDDLHFDDLVDGGAAAMFGRNGDVLGDARITRYHQTQAVLQMKTADDAGVGAFQHLHYPALAAAAPIDAQHAGQGAIAVQHRTHLFGRKEQIVAAFVGHQETETVGVTHHPAAHQIHFFRQAVVAIAVENHLAVALHGAQPAAQGLQLFLVAEA